MLVSVLICASIMTCFGRKKEKALPKESLICATVDTKGAVTKSEMTKEGEEAKLPQGQKQNEMPQKPKLEKTIVLEFGRAETEDKEQKEQMNGNSSDKDTKRAMELSKTQTEAACSENRCDTTQLETVQTQEETERIEFPSAISPSVPTSNQPDSTSSKTTAKEKSAREKSSHGILSYSLTKN